MSDTSENPSEDVQRDTPKKGDIPPGMQKVCGVCGDRALGYNFNAISCESCKAFFRRNAIAGKEFKCPFSDSCTITVVTRRFCQKCRLEKCFGIGMMKDLIMTNEDKAEKRKKIEENRAKKRPLRGSSEEIVTSSKHFKREDRDESRSPQMAYPNSPHMNEPPVIQYDDLNSTTSSPAPFPVDLDTRTQSPYQFGHSSEYRYQAYYPEKLSQQRMRPDPYGNVPDAGMFETQENKRENTIRSILTSKPENAGSETARHPHDACVDMSSTSYQNINKARDILEDVERIPIEPNSIESILCEAIKLEFEAYSSVSHSNSSNRELNEVERAKLNELIVANKALHAPIDMDITSLVGYAAGIERELKDNKCSPTLLSIINLTAVAIRRLIKMAKKINAFKNMCEEDQVALLKGGCTEMMILRSTITYDCARNSWKIPHLLEEQRCIKTDVLKLAKGNVYHAHENFIRTFDPRWRTDENIILIMSAILLFTPDRPKVVHKDVIKLEQNSYYYLLRRYLESVYPGCEAKSIFLKLIQKIMELHRLAEEVIGVYLDVNPIDPLLMEIFDLKEHT